MASQEGEIAMLRQQLLESHGRAVTISGYVAQAMGMLQEREAWWRRAAAAPINERAILLEEAKAQETTHLIQMSLMGQALQHLSTDATLSESQPGEKAGTHCQPEGLRQQLAFRKCRAGEATPADYSTC